MFIRSILVSSSVLFALSTLGCSGADPEATRQQQQESTCSDVRITCPVDTHCEMKGINGGQVPACIKNSDVCTGALCPAGTHCEPRGINGGVAPACIQDPVNDPSCPSALPTYGDACTTEGLGCTYMQEQCGEWLPLDVSCSQGKWHWYATGACQP